MKRLFLLYLITLTVVARGTSQSVHLDFPHFAGKQYYFWAFRGDGKDTIATGKLDSLGKCNLVLPQRLKNFRGMTQWRLTGGGGLDIIFADGENFTVSCSEEQPSEENIIYRDSRENTYLNARYHRQQDILGKTDAMRMAAQAYKDNYELLSIFNTELRKQEQAYNLLQEETARNSLYAARFAQIVDITRGLPPVLSSVQEDTDLQLKDFVLNNLDIGALYRSGHWTGVLEQFLAWYTYNEQNKESFIPDAIKILKRTYPDQVYEDLAEKIISACDKQGWNDQEIELGFFLMNQDRIKEPKGNTASLYTLMKIRKGAQAPLLIQGTLPKQKTILAFYDSGCGNCTVQMAKLAELYPALKKQGYEVVSVAADSDKGMFASYAEKLPWKDKYCDFEGFAGKDFLSYGIMGTPTFYMLDAKGIVQGRYARVEDMMPVGEDIKAQENIRFENMQNKTKI